MSSNTELSIKETLIGVLNSKDLDGNGIIHSSDFRKVINELNISNNIIDNILLYCTIDNNGNINYNLLKEEVKKERKVYNNNKANTSNTANKIISTTGTPNLPYRPNKNKNISNNNNNLIQKFSKEIHNIYNEYIINNISNEDVINLLLTYDIQITKQFLTLINKSYTANNDISYSDFIRSLMSTDNNNIDSVAAGAYKSRDISNSLLSYSKRHNGVVMNNRIFNSNIDNNHSNIDPLLKQRPTRKLHQTRSMKTTAEVYDTFHMDDGKQVPLLSHLQEDLVIGTDATPVDISFNSEQRLQRDQVMAILRKLDSGAITLPDFQDKMYNMGYDLPDNVQSQLRHAVQAGSIDIHRFSKLIDSFIFKNNIINNRNNDAIMISNIKHDFIRIINNNNSIESLLNIGQLFRKLDTDKDGYISYTEFKHGYNNFINSNSNCNGIDEDSLRLLFNSFDTNGDGVLEFEEFLSGIGGKLVPSRLNVVNNAFNYLDRNNNGYVSLDDAAELLQVSSHPDVVNGNKSEREVLNSFITWFTCAKDFNGTISYDNFLSYYCCISALIANDKDFINHVSLSWGLTDKRPPPPEYYSHHGPPLPPPIAKQSHGDVITWEQEPSRLERNEASSSNIKMKRPVLEQSLRNHHTNVINWKNYHGLGHKDPQAAYADEFGLNGGFSISRRQENNYSSKSLLAWSKSNNKTNTQVLMPDPLSPTAPVNPYELEHPIAGSPTRKSVDSNHNIHKKISQLSAEQYHHCAPYDRDNATTTASSNSNNKPKSLSEIMKEKKASTTSLSQHIRSYLL